MYKHDKLLLKKYTQPTKTCQDTPLETSLRNNRGPTLIRNVHMTRVLRNVLK